MTQGRRGFRWRGRSRFKRITYATPWRQQQRANWKRLRRLAAILVVLTALSALVVLAPS